MSIHDYSAEDLQFGYWFERMLQIQREGHGAWRGNRHPDPVLLHKLIDDEKDRLLPLLNPQLEMLRFSMP